MTNARELTVLGIETSCDETAASIVRGCVPGPGQILSNIVAAQIAEHQPFGGVVPEIAARAHASMIDKVTRQALDEASMALSAVDAISVTAGPGLIGGVVVGLMFAKGLAIAANKPLLAVNHLAAHALTVRLTHGVPCPYLLLLISGGHCQLHKVNDPANFERLGTTIDDAAGEAFDKTAKLLGLDYPGGPQIEAKAALGNPARFEFPRPLLDQPGLDFSFSGLKTAVRRTVNLIAPLSAQDKADIAAGFQMAVTDILVKRSVRAMVQVRSALGPSPLFVVAGGVAANLKLRSALEIAAHNQGFEMIVAPVALCTDNAAMVAWAGIEALGLRSGDPMTVSPRARWPLDSRFEGIKGAKA